MKLERPLGARIGCKCHCAISARVPLRREFTSISITHRPGAAFTSVKTFLSRRALRVIPCWRKTHASTAAFYIERKFLSRSFMPRARLIQIRNAYLALTFAMHKCAYCMQAT